MSDKRTMIIYHDWLPLFKSMETAGVCKILFALMEYDASGDMPELEFENKLQDAIYRQMLALTVENHEAYLETCRRRAENVKKRWNKQNDTNEYKSIKEYRRV